MSEKKKYSIIIRIACGLLGSGGIAVPFIIFHALKSDNFVFAFNAIPIAYVSFLFVYIAIKGEAPLKLKHYEKPVNPVFSFFGKSAAMIIICIFSLFIVFCIFVVVSNL